MYSKRCSLNLRVGEWVEVRSAREIQATLDVRQCIDELPFMPEMLQFCGRPFRVSASAHKTADTVGGYSIRRMQNSVHLEELRCDGMSHGGCQAGCLLFWKTAWLKRVPQGQRIYGISHHESAVTAQGRSLSAADGLPRGTECTVTKGKSHRYRCQATEMAKATTSVRKWERWNPLFYVRDLTSGNVKPFEFIRFGALAMLNAFLMRWFQYRLPMVRGLAGEKTPSVKLNLQPGESVQVRSKQEIERTLNSRLQNRGMWFDDEMVLYCAKGPYEVLRPVERIINENTGEMISLKNPCVILNGLTCSGNYLYSRMFSRRREYFFWREIWLQRVGGVGSGN